MSPHKHRPRRIPGIESEHRHYDLAICHCGKVARLTTWNKETTEGSYTLTWELAEDWRDPKSFEQEHIDEFFPEL